MTIERRYENWDALPPETARAGRERKVDAMIALESTTLALKKARDEVKKAKAALRPARPKGETPRARFIKSFEKIVWDFSKETREYNLPGNPAALFFNPVGERLEVFTPLVVQTLRDPVPSWVIARLEDLDPEVVQILDPERKFEVIVTVVANSPAYLYQHIIRFKRTGSWD